MVVRALAESPWGIVTVGATIPIAMFMGCYLRFGRIGKVMEASAIGVVLLLLAVWAGKFAHQSISLSKFFGLHDITLAWVIIAYGLAASVLPVWLLLAPRDYLSTFMKLGTIFALAVGIFLVLPDLQMPAISKFIDGSGPVVAGKIFPFCFITIACGAISGFHTLIASGTTLELPYPREYLCARPIGYGAMCLESLVAIMALIAACTLDPGVYQSMNVKGDAVATAAKVTAHCFPLTVDQHETSWRSKSGKNLVRTYWRRSNTGGGNGANFLQGTQRSLVGSLVSLRDYVRSAVHPDDPGRRNSRGKVFGPGHPWHGLAATRRHSKTFPKSARQPARGLWLGLFFNSGRTRSARWHQFALWPLFGIANQMLAAIALCLGTTILLKMALQKRDPSPSATAIVKLRGSPAIALVTLLPLLWLLAVTMTAGVEKIFHPDPANRVF